MSDEQAVPHREALRSDITAHLIAWSAGNDEALHAVFSTLHDRLSQLAARAPSGERANHTLGTAGLISETYMRMLEQQHLQWRSREQFIAIAAQMMRRVLIDYARGRRTAKRGHGMLVVPLAEATPVHSELLDCVEAIHDALEALGGVNPLQSKIIELRFFGGMTHEEIGSYLRLSVATVERRWRLGRAWLYRYLSRTGLSQRERPYRGCDHL
jgi:RNA polymerase sigma factor (TIGR02999 family)